jgi:CelD/BcsL family acetyltransferase involved in cellulose biosynthesis
MTLTAPAVDEASAIGAAAVGSGNPGTPPPGTSNLGTPDLGTLNRTPNTNREPGAANPEPPSASFELVADYGRFVELEAEWNDAVERAGVTHPFLCHEWFRTWWDCFGGGRALHIIVARRNDKILAIAPLMRERSQAYGIPVRKLDLLHNDHTPRADVIVAGSADEGYRAIWAALQDTRDEWDLLQLSRLPQDSPTRAAFEQLAGEAQCATGVWRGDVSPYLALSGTWESYLASLSAKFRSNLRNRLSRLTKLGEPALEVLEDADAIERARGDALRLEASGWKAQAGTSICSDPAVERFYTRLAERATDRGWLRLLFLTAGGQRIATSYGSCYRGRLFLFKTGYDPEYATCSPFKLLTYFAIQAAYAEGLSEVDFLGDVEPWKLEWTQAARSHDWLYVFSHSKRAQLLHWMKFEMRGPRRAVFARWGAVVPELKKWRA